MKKIIIFLMTIFLSLSLFQKKADASCVETDRFDLCAGQQSCNIDGQKWFCCTLSQFECRPLPSNTPIPEPKCDGGLVVGEKRCDPADSHKYQVCINPSDLPVEEYQTTRCANGAVCQDGECVSSNLRCSNGSLDGARTCVGGESFICEAGGVPEYVQGQGCFSSQVCVEGVGCSFDVTPTSVPSNPGSGNLTNDSFLILVNPLTIGTRFGLIGGLANVFRFDKPSDILNVLMPFLFVFAGMILFVMLLWGGFEMLSSAATPDSKNAGQQRITAAIIGFVLLFVSYWIAQIVQFITGVNVLG